MYDELVKRLRSHNGWALNQTLDEAADAIEELSKSRWIPVTERLPGDNTPVLVVNDDGKVIVAKYEKDIFGWYYKYCEYDFDVWDALENGVITHWMPLPEPPKEEQ